jgi:hypothetical protein
MEDERRRGNVKFVFPAVLLLGVMRKPKNLNILVVRNKVGGIHIWFGVWREKISTQA